MTERRCDTCEFWERRGVDDDEPVEDRRGLCRRAPPRPTHGDFEYEVLHHLTMISWRNSDEQEKEIGFGNWEEAVEAPAIWPLTLGGDWCGEWRVTTR